MGTFENRMQAEQAMAELKQAGFRDDEIELEEQTRAQQPEGALSSAERVVVRVMTDERQQEAATILRRDGAIDTPPFSATTPSETHEAAGPYEPSSHMSPTAASEPIVPRVEYDPIRGPHEITEDVSPLASGGFGLQRDPALDEDTPVEDAHTQPGSLPPDSNATIGQTPRPDDPHAKESRAV
jgi:hypothetical protein